MWLVSPVALKTLLLGFLIAVTPFCKKIMSSFKELKPLQIPLQDIISATNNFATENYIGLGGFGKVFKGTSEKHGTIAVKRLDHDRSEQSQGDREFKTEIALLSIYKHENIVSLLGFCDEDGEKMLVYKYESNGSLDKHLKNTDLTWTQRLQICLDAARGLQYLHHDVVPKHRILHRDVKSANILLDENWKAKISDFGLSRNGPAAQSSFVISNACGTLGYIDPEYYCTGHLSPKSDVFSFGVVLFEVLCGRPAFLKVDDQFFFAWVRKHYKRQTLDKIIYSGLHGQINTYSLQTFSSVAYQCLSNGEERPTMKEVMEQLQKALDNQLMVSRPCSGIYDANAKVLNLMEFEPRKSRKHEAGIRTMRITHIQGKGNVEVPPEDGFSWKKYGQKEILGSRFPRVFEFSNVWILHFVHFVASASLKVVEHLGTINDFTGRTFGDYLVFPVAVLGAVLDAWFILCMFSSLSKKSEKLQMRRSIAELVVLVSIVWIEYQIKLNM